MQRIIVIVGPTASGKSALAVRLAKKFNGEVISADSRQVYRGLDIGSGKVTKKEMAGVPHHLLGVVSPRRAYTVAEFARAARRAIADIARRGKIPLIAGGTAFWIDIVVYGFRLPEVPPNHALRKRLASKSPAALLSMLKKLDPARAKTIEQKNPRRLIRAIEIARAIGTTPPLRRHAAFDALWIGLNQSYETRSHRIEKRVRGMIRQGLIAETKKLLRQGVDERRIREFGFEYAAALDTIVEKMPRAELAPRVIRDTARYAKKQMAWWRRNRAIHWITGARAAERAVRRWRSG